VTAAARSRAAVSDVTLAATLHDASGSLASMMREWLPALAAQYRAVLVATSPPTAPRVRAMLATAGVYAGTPSTNTRGPLYRLALRKALDAGGRRVHYLDFDRALHWVARRPRELEALLRCTADHPVLLVGRTPAAHRTHHRPLVETETEANRAFARRLGVGRRLDFLVPSFVLTRDATVRLLARSRARDAAIYGEWAALIAGLGRSLAYVECRGLDWETPDRRPRQVARIGLAAWRRRFERADEWERRRRMSREFIRSFELTLARWPVRRWRLRSITIAATRAPRLHARATAGRVGYM